MRKYTIAATLIALPLSVEASLWIDFNSTNQDGGPHPNGGSWQNYNAAHEVAADFVTQNYSAYGTSVGVTPAWPNTGDNRVQQMIDRGNQTVSPVGGFDASWTDTDLNLVTDFIGTDTRIGNGGNGDWDGTTGTPTYFTLSLSNLPAGDHQWVSFHHDTEHVHGTFAVWLSVDGGTTFNQLADGVMTDGTDGGVPDSGVGTEVGDFAGMTAAGSIYNTSFTANGTDDVVIRFAPYSGGGVHRQIWGINGFQVSAAPIPEPSTSLLGLIGLAFLARRKR